MSGNDTAKTLSPKQMTTIEALLSTTSTEEAAKVAGVGRATINRWLKDPEFQKALLAAEGDALGQISRTLIAMASKATDALADGLNPNEKINVRLRASEQLLNNLLKIRELVQLESRLLAIEERLGANSDEMAVDE